MGSYKEAKSYVSRVTSAVDKARDDLVKISMDIHSHPELNFEEYYSSKALAEALERYGFDVERGVGGVETAFKATLKGSAGDGPTVAFLAEYDALPGIGHGCGHNLIALSNLGAGIGAMAALDELPGRIVVLGTPAEEGGGGKIRMLDAGVFDGIDVCLSSHPSSNRTTIQTEVPMNETWSLAMVGYRYEYSGKASHAARVPHEGINALNAVIHLFTGIDALRQHLREDVRIHGIITNGGKAPNVVPDFAAANFMLRCTDREYLELVVEKVRDVAEGASKMTGARLKVVPEQPMYENVIPNAVLSSSALANADVAGLALVESLSGESVGGGSTDFGNVSQVMPSYYTRFAVGTEPVPAHSLAMAEAAKTEFAQNVAITVAKVLALTACDILSDPNLLAAAREEFAVRTGS